MLHIYFITALPISGRGIEFVELGFIYLVCGWFSLFHAHICIGNHICLACSMQYCKTAVLDKKIASTMCYGYVIFFHYFWWKWYHIWTVSSVASCCNYKFNWEIEYRIFRIPERNSIIPGNTFYRFSTIQTARGSAHENTYWSYWHDWHWYKIFAQ